MRVREEGRMRCREEVRRGRKGREGGGEDEKGEKRKKGRGREGAPKPFCLAVDGLSPSPGMSRVCGGIMIYCGAGAHLSFNTGEVA